MSVDSTSELVSRLLTQGVVLLEARAAQNSGNHFEIRCVAEAASLLGRQDLADRAVRLLQQLPDSSFFAGAITNFALPEKVPASMRTIDSPAILDEKIPRVDRSTMLQRLRSFSDPHIQLCLAGSYSEAMKVAKEGLPLEEVGCTLGILGQFEHAAAVASAGELEKFRRRGVLDVLVIEQFRSGQTTESLTRFAELESAGLGASGCAMFALGFAGREPWGGYPYPDW